MGRDIGDEAQRAGERFGLYLEGQLNSLRTRTMTVTSIEGEYAMCVIYEEDNPIAVPLTMLNGTLHITPTVGSLVLVTFINGDENQPCIVDYESADVVEFVRSNTVFRLTIDPEDPENDTLTASIGSSSLKVDKDVIEFNGGSLNGLIKIDDLTRRLNDLVNTFNAHTHNVPAGSFLISATSGVSNPAPIPVQTPSNNASAFNKSDYENLKITQ